MLATTVLYLHDKRMTLLFTENYASNNKIPVIEVYKKVPTKSLVPLS